MVPWNLVGPMLAGFGLAMIPVVVDTIRERRHRRRELAHDRAFAAGLIRPPAVETWEDY